MDSKRKETTEQTPDDDEQRLRNLLRARQEERQKHPENSIITSDATRNGSISSDLPIVGTSPSSTQQSQHQQHHSTVSYSNYSAAQSSGPSQAPPQAPESSATGSKDTSSRSHSIGASSREHPSTQQKARGRRNRRERRRMNRDARRTGAPQPPSEEQQRSQNYNNRDPYYYGSGRGPDGPGRWERGGPPGGYNNNNNNNNRGPPQQDYRGPPERYDYGGRPRSRSRSRSGSYHRGRRRSRSSSISGRSESALSRSRSASPRPKRSRSDNREGEKADSRSRSRSEHESRNGSKQASLSKSHGDESKDRSRSRTSEHKSQESANEPQEMDARSRSRSHSEPGSRGGSRGSNHRSRSRSDHGGSRDHGSRNNGSRNSGSHNKRTRGSKEGDRHDNRRRRSYSYESFSESTSSSTPSEAEKDEAKKEEKVNAFTKDQRTVFVTQLVMRATEKDIRRYFKRKVGCKINEVILLRDKRTGRHKGSAYVQLGRVEDISKAISVSGQAPDFQRFPILVKASESEKNYVIPASSAILTATMMGAVVTSGPMVNEDGKLIEAQKVYVGSLDPSVSEEHLFALFSQFGQLEKVSMQMDPATRSTRGYAFLSFRDPKEANLAIQTMSNQVLAGRPMKTGWANQSSSIAGVEIVTSDEFPDDASTRAQRAYAVLAQLMGTSVSSSSASVVSASISNTAEEAINAALGVTPDSSLPNGGSSSVPTVAEARAIHSAQQNAGASVSSNSVSIGTVTTEQAKIIGGASNPTNNILVRNMFDKDMESDADWEEDIKQEFEEEAAKFGKLIKVIVMSKEVGGKIYASFEAVEAASNCAASLAGRWFDKRQLRVEYIQDADMPTTT